MNKCIADLRISRNNVRIIDLNLFVRWSQLSSPRRRRIADDQIDDETNLREFIVEMMWVASVNQVDRNIAALNRRQILELFLIVMEGTSMVLQNLGHNQIHGVALAIGNSAPVYLRDDFIDNFLQAMNTWDNISRSYHLRAYMESLIRRLLLTPVVPTTDLTCNNADNTTNAAIMSDLTTCHNNGEATLEEVPVPTLTTRTVQQEMNLQVAASSVPPPAVAAVGVNHSIMGSEVGYHLSGDDSGTDDDNNIIINRFRRGEYELLREMDTDQVMEALSSNMEVLRQLLEPPPAEDSANDKTTAAANDAKY